MNKKAAGLLVAIAVTGASFFVLTAKNPAQKGGAATDAPSPVIVTEVASPSGAYMPCYYVWASQELPEIGAELQSVLQDVLPGAEARAQAYGENCVAEDGSSTFGAMETDFQVTIPVADLDDSAALGKALEQALLIIIERFPRPVVPGGMDGYVEFSFTAGADTFGLRAPIALAKELLEQGLGGAELLQALENRRP
ncbi:MAG: hypothetical protein HFACDABA_03119 [Anaerolineales bacterium]|nr:hypothetical protein [Anaerolineales bacterium]